MVVIHCNEFLFPYIFGYGKRHPDCCLSTILTNQKSSRKNFYGTLEKDRVFLNLHNGMYLNLHNGMYLNLHNGMYLNLHNGMYLNLHNEL